MDSMTSETVAPAPTEPAPRAKRGRYGKGRKMIETLAAHPGEWVEYRSGQTQHQAHAYASWLRRTYPEAEWLARRVTPEHYATFGRLIGTGNSEQA